MKSNKSDPIIIMHKEIELNLCLQIQFFYKNIHILNYRLLFKINILVVVMH